MNEFRILSPRLARFAVFVVFFLECPASGACVAPQYHVARTLENTASDVSLQISVQLADFAPARLVCLAGTLRQKYQDRNVWVALFSARDAAQNYTPTIERTEATI